VFRNLKEYLLVILSRLLMRERLEYPMLIIYPTNKTSEHCYPI